MRDVTVKIKLVVFGVRNDALVVFLEDWSLPVKEAEGKVPLEEQVENLFFKTVGEKNGNNFIEQLYTISNERNEITIVYYVLVPLTIHLSGFKPVTSVPKSSADKSIVSYAVQRLQWKLEYTNVVYSFLPQEFTLSELQKTYEAILGQILDKRNFRKKILSLHFLEPTGKRRFGVSRPAQMYMFKKRTPTMVKIFS